MDTNNTEKLQNQNLILKRIVIVYFILTILVIAGILTYLINDLSNDVAFAKMGPLPDSAAIKNVSKFGARHAMFVTPKHDGAFYDTLDIKNYVDSIFRQRMLRHIQWQLDNHVDTSQFQWKVGLCWMMSPDGTDHNKIKHDVCFLPILISKCVNSQGKHHVYDYFDSLKTSKLYFHPKAIHSRSYIMLQLNDDDPNAFDTGEIWP